MYSGGRKVCIKKMGAKEKMDRQMKNIEEEQDVEEAKSPIRKHSRDGFSQLLQPSPLS